jgi:hypothetical protein
MRDDGWWRVGRRSWKDEGEFLMGERKGEKLQTSNIKKAQGKGEW